MDHKNMVHINYLKILHYQDQSQDTGIIKRSEGQPVHS